MNLNFQSEIADWATLNFGGVDLYDRRRTNRLVLIATKLAENKGTTLARLFDRWYDVKATYNLLNHRLMDPEIIQAEHRKVAFEAMKAFDGDVLAIEDDSEFEWNQNEPIEGLGPVGSGKKHEQGFILHSTLAIGVKTTKQAGEGGVEILGLPFQQYYIRKKHIAGRRKNTQNLETDLWRTALQEKALPAKKNIIRVCDRAADIYEVLVETQKYGCSYIIRLRHNRLDLETKIPIQGEMREEPSLGTTLVDKGGLSIEMNLNWKTVSLKPPQRAGDKLDPLQSTVVHVWGKNPKTEELIEWFLHTNLPVNSLQDAIKVCQYYALRWIIEDYHKSLKSGLRAENLQLKTAHALFAAISIMSVVALRIVNLREKLRLEPDQPAARSGLSAEEIKVLGAYLKRDIKTVKCVALAIGRLGGHQNRRSDGMPGMMALWWGMSRFLTIMEGVRLFTN